MEPGVGLEPTRLAAADFESAASTNSATRANERGRKADARGAERAVNPIFAGSFVKGGSLTSIPS